MKCVATDVVIKVGGEGGSITLYGRRRGEGWIFSLQSLDQSPMFFDEPSEQKNSLAVATWPEALALLDSYPWHRLCPDEVHPDFRTAVLDAVNARYGDAADWNRLADWQTLCEASNSK